MEQMHIKEIWTREILEENKGSERCPLSPSVNGSRLGISSENSETLSKNNVLREKRGRGSSHTSPPHTHSKMESKQNA